MTKSSILHKKEKKTILQNTKETHTSMRLFRAPGWA